MSMTEQEIKLLLRATLQEYFSPNGENKKFFDATQIPRICNDIREINETLKGLTTQKTSDDHEIRLRTLEKNMWRNAGIASVLGALGMWALSRMF